MTEAAPQTRQPIRLETNAGKLVLETEIPPRAVMPGVILRAGAVFVKVAGRPAFPWQPVVYREAEALDLSAQQRAAA